MLTEYLRDARKSLYHHANAYPISIIDLFKILEGRLKECQEQKT